MPKDGNELRNQFKLHYEKAIGALKYMEHEIEFINAFETGSGDIELKPDDLIKMKIQAIKYSVESRKQINECRSLLNRFQFKDGVKEKIEKKLNEYYKRAFSATRGYVKELKKLQQPQQLEVPQTAQTVEDIVVDVRNQKQINDANQKLIDQVKQQLGEYMANTQKKKTQLESGLKELGELQEQKQNEMQATKQSIQVVQGEIDQLNYNKFRYQSELAEVSLRMNILGKYAYQVNAKSTSEELKRLKGFEISYKTELYKIDSSIKQQENELKKKQQSISDLTEECDKIKTKMQNKGAELAELEPRIKAHQEVIERLNGIDLTKPNVDIIKLQELIGQSGQQGTKHVILPQDSSHSLGSSEYGSDDSSLSSLSEEVGEESDLMSQVSVSTENASLENASKKEYVGIQLVSGNEEDVVIEQTENTSRDSHQTNSGKEEKSQRDSGNELEGERNTFEVTEEELKVIKEALNVVTKDAEKIFNKYKKYLEHPRIENQKYKESSLRAESMKNTVETMKKCDEGIISRIREISTLTPEGASSPQGVENLITQINELKEKKVKCVLNMYKAYKGFKDVNDYIVQRKFKEDAKHMSQLIAR